MNSIRKLLPGQPGTKKWLEKYGERLLCVRYRYDEARKRKIKTLEIIVENKPWEPNNNRIPKNKIVHLRIQYGEVSLGKMVRAAGGQWNRKKGVWELPYSEVIALGLVDRMVQEKI